MTRVRRILVAVDASPASLAAAEAAARLAVRLGAEVSGLFVEEVETLAVASHPAARRADLLAGRPGLTSTRKMERELRLQGERVRRALEATGRRTGRSVPLEVLRGQAATTILAAAAEADLVALGRVGWAGGWGEGLGRTVRRVLEHGAVPAVLVSRSALLEPPHVVLTDGSEAARRALRLAARIHGSEPGELVVRPLATSGRRVEELAEEAVAELDQAGVGVVTEGATVHPERLDALLRDDHGLLLLPVATPTLTPDRLGRLLGEAECPVLLLR